MRKCYPFLSRYKLCANLDKNDGHQKLEICTRVPKQKIDAACKCKSEISCIHTIVNVQLDENGNFIPISSERRRIDLPIETKWLAFKSWTQGIAEAGMDAFSIQNDIELGRAYPIMLTLAQYIAKREPKFKAKLPKNVRDTLFYKHPDLP